MFCEKCGKKIEEGALFCGNCGARVENETISSSQTQEENPMTFEKPMKKKLGKNKIIVIVIVAIIIIAAIIAAVVLTSPTSKMNRAIAKGDIEEAYDIYYENFFGEGLPDSTVNALKEYVDDIVEKYELGEIDYDALSEAFAQIEVFFEYDESIEKYVDEARDKVQDLYRFQFALESAEEYYSNGEYLYALNKYKTALEINPDSEEASDGVTKAESSYRDYVLAEADKYISSRDYESAANILNTGLSNLPNDSDLTDKLDGLSEQEVQDIVDDAYTYANGGDWDSAVELLEDAQYTYSSNEKIEEAYADITDKMPITLKNITVISSEGLEVEKSVIKDRYGNIYDGGVSYNAFYDDFGLYNLSEKYTTFTATAFVSTETENGQNLSISIYVDENLVYYKDEISEESQPIEITVDVNGANTMRIVVEKADGPWGSSVIYFADSNFEKVEDSETNQ